MISLRDDVFKVRKECDVPGRNLLYFSGRLDARADATANLPGWSVRGCSTGTSCVTTSIATASGSPGDDDQLRSAGIYDVRFKEAAGGLVQDIAIRPDVYVLSWYSSGTEQDDTPFVRLLDDNNAAIAPTSSAEESVQGVGSGFARRWQVYDLTTGARARKLSLSSSSPSGVYTVGAFMLEAREDGSPSAYENATAELTRRVPACADLDGQVFQRTHWKKRCLQLCPNGYAEACDGDAANVECFHETSFAINQRGIETGDFLSFAGFARGNFNYRISDIGVNFVGTNILACENSEAPQTCYSSGNLQFSLLHSGPYYVRNHEGRDARLQLFQGRIEHAGPCA